MPAGQRPKKVLSEAQKAALARGQAKRRANISAGRASHARQAASSRTSQLVALASQPEAAIDSEVYDQADVAALDAQLQSGSGQSSSGSKKSKLTQEEQDRLIFDFNMGDDASQGDAKQQAQASKPGKPGLGEKLAGMLRAPKDAPARPGGVTDKEEEDAQRAAA